MIDLKTWELIDTKSSFRKLNFTRRCTSCSTIFEANISNALLLLCATIFLSQIFPNSVFGYGCVWKKRRNIFCYIHLFIFCIQTFFHRCITFYLYLHSIQLRIILSKSCTLSIMEIEYITNFDNYCLLTTRAFIQFLLLLSRIVTIYRFNTVYSHTNKILKQKTMYNKKLWNMFTYLITVSIELTVLW